MSIDVVLRLLLLLAEAVNQQLKKHDKAVHDERIQAIKDDPRSAFSDRFNRLRNNGTDNPAVPSDDTDT